MAKYIDPNTGVKYSTHTGLKVFTVIVVILLVISIVLNVVLYTQSSDDSVIDSGENGELDKGGEDEDSSEGDGTPEPGEGIVDTETIIENEYVDMTSDFDEHGAATCIYCGFNDPVEAYTTKGGAVYDYHPDVRTQILAADDNSTDINSEIRVSLVFERYSECVEYVDYYYCDMTPADIEIVSLTGEPLAVESVELKQYIYYELIISGYNLDIKGYRSKSGVNVDIFERTTYKCPELTSIYGLNEANFGEFTFSITLKDGNTYSFEFWCIGTHPNMLEVELEDVD